MPTKFMTGVHAKRAINTFLTHEVPEYVQMEKDALLADAFGILRGIDKATLKYEISVTDDIDYRGERVSAIKFLELRGYVYTDRPLTDTSIEFDASASLAAMI